MRRAERIGWIAVALACVPALGAGLHWRTVRAERAALTAPAATPPPSVRPASAERVAAFAREQGLLIEDVSVADGETHLILSGPESRILAFAAALEGGRPAVRLTDWTLEAIAGGAVRLQAGAVMAARATPAALPARALFGTAAPQPTTDAPELAGIVGRLPNDAVALVRGEDGRAVTVAPGKDAPGGWRLETLSADAAIFVRGQERARVPLPAAEE